MGIRYKRRIISILMVVEILLIVGWRKINLNLYKYNLEQSIKILTSRMSKI